MNNTKHGPQLLIGVLFILIFAASLYVVFVMQVQLDDVLEKIAFTLIGVLATNTTTIINFFFGSSAGSKEKTSALSPRTVARPARTAEKPLSEVKP